MQKSEGVVLCSSKKLAVKSECPLTRRAKENIMCYNAALTDTMNFLRGFRSQKRYDHIIISF